METRSEMARLWLYGNHEISSKVKYYLILRYGTVEQAMEQSVSELEKELVKQFEPAEYQTLLLRKNSNYLDEVYGRLKERNIRILYPGHPLYPESLQISTINRRFYLRVVKSGRASIIIINRLRLWVRGMQIHTVKKRHVSSRESLQRQESRL